MRVVAGVALLAVAVALAMPLPQGWSHSVAYGHTPGGAAAWLYVGNFRFRQRGEATPSVPRGRVLITLGDFPVLGDQTRGWPRVDRLRLPARKTTWHVVFDRRAVYLSVHFGSKPDARMRALVNRRLAAVRRR